MTLWPSARVVNHENTGTFEGVLRGRFCRPRPRKAAAGSEIPPRVPHKRLLARGLAYFQQVARKCSKCCGLRELICLRLHLLPRAAACKTPSLRVLQLALCQMSVTADNSRAYGPSTTPSWRTGGLKVPVFACAAACECCGLREQQLAKKTPPGGAHFRPK